MYSVKKQSRRDDDTRPRRSGEQSRTLGEHGGKEVVQQARRIGMAGDVPSQLRQEGLVERITAALSKREIARSLKEGMGMGNPGTFPTKVD